MAVETLNDLFCEMLKDIYYAEKKILKSLPKMAKNATSPKLIKAFETHKQETEGQIQRLEQVFASIGEKARGKKCDAIEGLIKETEAMIKEVECSSTLDAGLAADAQAVEHYEIARYGALVAWAQALGYTKAAKLLQQTLDEEKKTDQLLSKMAEGGLNDKAVTAMNDNNEDQEEEAA